MSFPRYSQYKDSGIQWLAEIPGHWSIQPMSALSTCNDDVLPESTNEEKLIKYIEISDVQMGKGIVNMSQMLFKNAPSRARRIVKIGDILVSTVRTYLRAIATVNFQCEDVIASTGFAVIRSKDINSKFLGFICESEYWISNVIAHSVGVSYPAINASELIKIRIPTPPNDEQVAIVDFLDQETAKIDALIAEQENLIELLKEKRQAVISHAVTKGLDPNVKMKDSGVEWLGQVPANWNTVRLKNLLTEPLMYGANEAAELEDRNLIRYIRITDITEHGQLKDETFKSLPTEIAASYKLLEGDILLARSGGTVGKTFMYLSEWGECCFAGYLIRARLDQSKCLSKWLNYFCQSRMYWDYIGVTQIQATIQNVSAEKYGQINIPLPSIDLQQQIIASLDLVDKLLDEFKMHATESVALLQERRSALISAAVTGQIDVRNVAITKEVA